VDVLNTEIHIYFKLSFLRGMCWCIVLVKKAKVTKSLGKNMFILFMDRKGMILTHAVPRGQTVNADYYCKVSLVLFVICSSDNNLGTHRAQMRFMCSS
jgi:hypothetical protein